MNNLKRKQKIALAIIAIISVIIIYLLMYYQEKNSLDIVQQDELDITQKEGKQDEIKNETEDKKIIKVHVSGAVNQEGVVELKENSRINDAIEKAGGLRADAYIEFVNLAYILEDGMKIYIPNVNEKEKIQEEVGQQTYQNLQNKYSNESNSIQTENNSSTLKNNAKANKININTANQTELETLPGIGPSIAIKIINYRNENGKFKLIEDLKEVNGIGESKFNKIKDLITIN